MKYIPTLILSVASVTGIIAKESYGPGYDLSIVSNGHKTLYMNNEGMSDFWFPNETMYLSAGDSLIVEFNINLTFGAKVTTNFNNISTLYDSLYSNHVSVITQPGHYEFVGDKLGSTADFPSYLAFNVSFSSPPPTAINQTTISLSALIQGAAMDTPIWVSNHDGVGTSGVAYMHCDLADQSILPPTEPYTALGYTVTSGSGLTYTHPYYLDSTGTSLSNTYVDWILFELRDHLQPEIVVYSKPMLLTRSGYIGGVPSYFDSIPCGNYHVAIRHRNHLGFMTAYPINLLSFPSSLEMDLRNGSIELWGTNPLHFDGTRYWMHSGDAYNASQNNAVKYAGFDNDRDPILQKVGGNVPTNTLTGYHTEDLNLDGVVKYVGNNNDRDLILVNIGGSVPTAVIVQQLP